MKNKKILCLCFSFALFEICFAQNNTSLKIEPFFGFKHGTIYECVYQNTEQFGIQKLSELDWHIKPIFYSGAKLCISYKTMDFLFYAGGYFPTKYNFLPDMEDSDWGNEENPSMKTTYSVSETKLDAGGFLGTSFCYNFQILSWLSISPTTTLEYEYLSFKAKNGEGWYGQPNANKPDNKNGYDSWDSENAIHYKKGELAGIDFKRNDFFIWLGINLNFTPIPKLKIQTGFDFAVFQIVSSVDQHYSGNSSGTFYYDIMYDFFKSHKARAEISYNITKKISIKTNAAFSFSSPIIGSSYTSFNTSEGAYTSSSVYSGSDFKYWDLTISFLYKFF